jgi:kynurenine formamidase
MSRRKIIDLSQEIFQGQPVYPGHQPTNLFPASRYEEKPDGKAAFAVNTLLVSEHAGTHTDSFAHMNTGIDAVPIEQLPLEMFMGPGICLDVSHVPESEFIEIADLQKALAKCEGTIVHDCTVLLYTGTFVRHFPHPEYMMRNPGLSREAAEWLCERDVQNIGIDAASIDVSPHKGYEWKAAHNVCKERWVLNTENLGDLRPVLNRKFEYIGVPIKIRGGTAGLVRAIALLDV